MHIEDLEKIANNYNVSSDVVLLTLNKILSEKFNLGDIYIKDSRLYERLINKEGIFKDKKIRITKKHIEEILDELKKNLLEIYHKNIKQNILKKFLFRVVEGEIIAKNDNFFIVSIKNCKYLGLLHIKKAFKKWNLGERGLFHINNITANDKEVIIYLDDFSIEIDKYRIYQLCSGIYIKELRIFKDKIIIKSSPKIDKKIAKNIQALFNKKVIKG